MAAVSQGVRCACSQVSTPWSSCSRTSMAKPVAAQSRGRRGPAGGDCRIDRRVGRGLYLVVVWIVWVVSHAAIHATTSDAAVGCPRAATGRAALTLAGENGTSRLLWEPGRPTAAGPGEGQ